MAEQKNDIQMPNNVILAPQNFGKLEKRLIYLSLELLKSKQEPIRQLNLFSDESEIDWNQDRTIFIPYNIIKKYGDWNKVKKAARSLFHHSIEILHPGKNGKVISEVFNLIERAKEEEGKGIRMTYTEFGMKTMTHLSKSYSKIPLESALLLSSKYSQRLFEILISKCYGNDYGVWKIELSEFRSLLGIEEDSSYYHWGSLERTTIKSVQNEFKLLSDKINLSFEYKAIKKGNKVVQVEFEIWHKQKNNITANINGFEFDNLSEKQISCLNILQKIGVADKHRRNIVENYLKEFFDWKYKSQFQENLVNPAGHLLKTLGLV